MISVNWVLGTIAALSLTIPLAGNSGDLFGNALIKGFEILGISFDQDKDKLTSTLASKGMTWAQYFDGEGWGNKFGKQWGIQSIPTMWLVNKKGVLCDVNGRENLKEKLVKVLAESI